MSDRSNLFTREVIRASAGTGKTFQLSNRFIGLLAGGEPVESILATTFTRKGAGEILDRVLERLAEAALEADKLAELNQFIASGPLDRDACLRLLRDLLGQLHRLRVGTLDSFFMLLARSFALELGLPPDWSILDETTESSFRGRAVLGMLRAEGTKDSLRLMHLLSKGETSRSVADQVSALLGELYNAFRDSSEDAWRRLEAVIRYTAARPLSADQLTAAFGRLCAIRSDKKSITNALEKDIAKVETEDWVGLLKQGISAKVAAGEPKYGQVVLSTEIIDAYRPIVDHALAVILQSIAAQNAATWEMLARLDGLLEEMKRVARLFRFDDITRKLASDRLTERLGAVAYRLDGRVGHLLLDEFQDTSPMQWRVLLPLARLVTASGAARSFFCVGDVKQAIYGWRGGVAEIFEAVDADLQGVTASNLNKSFRSSPVVIETVNETFGGIEANTVVGKKFPAAASAWQARFSPHETARTEYPGYCQMETAPRAGEGQTKEDVTLRFAALRIAEIVQDCPGRSVGVLVRKNSAIAKLIYLLRTNHGIRASEEGGNPLTDSAPVQLILSALHLADHPGDLPARFHVATSPLAQPLGLHDHHEDEAAAEASRQIRLRLLDDGYGQVLTDWTRALAPVCDQRDLGRLMQLVELGYDYTPRATLRTADFISLVTRRRVESPSSADVRVMTVHQSKGLQFDVVVLPQLDAQLVGQTPPLVVGRKTPTSGVDTVCRYVNQDTQRLLPDDIARLFGRQRNAIAEESLSVLYVAMTRAVHSLHMIIAPSAENERNLPTTFAGVLRGALTDGQPVAPESLCYENGDPEWHQHGAAPAPRPAEVVSLDVRLAPPPDRTGRGLEHQSPSSLEGGRTIDLRQKLTLDDAGMRYGTLIHAWLEDIEWLEDYQVDDERLMRLAVRAIAARERPSWEIAAFRRLLQGPEIAGLLTRPGKGVRNLFRRADAGSSEEKVPDTFSVRVDREYEFAVRTGETITRGIIDRLVTLTDGTRPIAADIIDYKTDAVDPDDPEALQQRIEYYRPQLLAYREAVGKLLRLPPEKISARLAMLAIDRVVEV